MRDKLLVQQSCQSYAAYEGWESLRLSVMMYAYMIKEDVNVQGWMIRPLPGLVNFAPAVAYNLCLNLPAAFPQPGSGPLVQSCS